STRCARPRPCAPPTTPTPAPNSSSSTATAGTSTVDGGTSGAASPSSRNGSPLLDDRVEADGRAGYDAAPVPAVHAIADMQTRQRRGGRAVAPVAPLTAVTGRTSLRDAACARSAGAGCCAPRRRRTATSPLRR